MSRGAWGQFCIRGHVIIGSGAGGYVTIKFGIIPWILWVFVCAYTSYLIGFIRFTEE